MPSPHQQLQQYLDQFQLHSMVSYAGSMLSIGLPAAVVTAAVHATSTSFSAYTVAVPPAIATLLRSGRNALRTSLPPSLPLAMFRDNTRSAISCPASVASAAASIAEAAKAVELMPPVPIANPLLSVNALVATAHTSAAL